MRYVTVSNLTKYTFLAKRIKRRILLNLLRIFAGSSKAQECDSVLTESGIIKSDGHPGGYPNNYDCIWIIEVKNRKVRLPKHSAS